MLPTAFFRFAASDSEDSSDSDGDDGEHRANGGETRGESSVRSAQPLSTSRHSPNVIKVNVLSMA